MTTIQHQLELDGYVLPLTYVSNIIDRHIETPIVVGWFMVFRNAIDHPLTKYVKLDASVVASKMTIFSTT